jgi:hypothetical protein
VPDVPRLRPLALLRPPAMWRAEVVADSVNEVTGDRLTTFCLEYPRLPVHEHFLTHRMLSRNTRSNRAVSTGKLADQPITRRRVDAVCDYVGSPHSVVGPP